jgi:hypothetical protein
LQWVRVMAQVLQDFGTTASLDLERKLPAVEDAMNAILSKVRLSAFCMWLDACFVQVAHEEKSAASDPGYEQSAPCPKLSLPLDRRSLVLPLESCYLDASLLPPGATRAGPQSKSASGAPTSVHFTIRQPISFMSKVESMDPDADK